MVLTVRHVAVEHLVMARLVHHLGRLEELSIGALDRLHELAAHEHGAVLAVEEQAQPEGREPAVELGPLLGAQPVPVGRTVDVDELVGEHAFVEVDGCRPVDVSRDVPLIALRVLVEAPELRVLDRICVLENGVEPGGDGVRGLGRWR
jgi:hypothetical protein